ncbi:putative peptide transport system ATP-binding protein [Aequitasia blattaphilus]|uniref:ATP-binding cassette domain-containing protein n=1 Tax=Aequitasia blattaphilus TaxID=2949332 RepID=A0ABT1E5G7_9FIRM|nr:ATP-binding cassette domain-containing protein [Aequitasia blattaphilus]MCP1101082.1 ATP-binding cassette domain-containing protein [Aequitasia blattaphilus]MCR8613722.1 ATP-binding cassette domain-containing protein [Aequitasia blattaphilus]
MLEFIGYSLKIGNKELIKNLNIKFRDSVISHLGGSNGVGKSCFAKSCINILDYEGEIKASSEPVVIGSYSNVPSDLRLNNLYVFLKSKYENKYVEWLFFMLGLDTIPKSFRIKNMSDGQKQKMKLLTFLASKPRVIILDEFTNAIDKKSTLDIYDFLIKYVEQEGVTCVNISHNLSDIEHMSGRYYYMEEKTIKEVDSKEEIIKTYIRGGR